MNFVHTNTPQFEELESVTTSSGRWYTTPSNNKYPSITTVLGHGEKPWLTDWRNSLGQKKADKETARCAERGTAVHLLAEKYLNNEENFTKGENKDYVKMFNQLKLRLNKINNIRAQEIPLYSDTLKIAGRVDCVAEYDGVLSVIDFKTANNNKDERMIQDYLLQCTAYAIMYHEQFGEPIEDIVVLIAVEKGIMPLMFRKKIDDYVKPLLKRINTFYKENSNG